MSSYKPNSRISLWIALVLGIFVDTFTDATNTEVCLFAIMCFTAIIAYHLVYERGN